MQQTVVLGIFRKQRKTQWRTLSVVCFMEAFLEVTELIQEVFLASRAKPWERFLRLGRACVPVLSLQIAFFPCFYGVCKDKRGVMRYTACRIVLNARIQVLRTFQRCIMFLAAGSPHKVSRCFQCSGEIFWTWNPNFGVRWWLRETHENYNLCSRKKDVLKLYPWETFERLEDVPVPKTANKNSFRIVFGIFSKIFYGNRSLRSERVPRFLIATHVWTFSTAIACTSGNLMIALDEGRRVVLIKGLEDVPERCSWQLQI